MLIKTQGPPYDPMNEYKGCAYRMVQKGHTIDGCCMLKSQICDLINYNKIPHLYGPYSMLKCDTIEPGVTISSNLSFKLHKI